MTQKQGGSPQVVDKEKHREKSETNVNFCSYDLCHKINGLAFYRDADKSLARPTSRCILFDG